MLSGLLELDRMRVLLAIALLGFGISGGSAVRAADLPIGHAGFYSARYYEQGERAGMLVVYADQPGVAVRAYWRAPWHHHHYFPATGRLPHIGRYENLKAHSPPPRRAQTYRRTWSNAAALDREYRRVPMLRLDARPLPRDELPPNHPDVLKP